MNDIGSFVKESQAGRCLGFVWGKKMRCVIRQSIEKLHKSRADAIICIITGRISAVRKGRPYGCLIIVQSCEG